MSARFASSFARARPGACAARPYVIRDLTGERRRLAKLISHRRTLLVLDGLEPLQNLALTLLGTSARYAGRAAAGVVASGIPA